LREPKRWTRVQKKATKEQAARGGPARDQSDRPDRGAPFDMTDLEDQFAELHKLQKGYADFTTLDHAGQMEFLRQRRHHQSPATRKRMPSRKDGAVLFIEFTETLERGILVDVLEHKFASELSGDTGDVNFDFDHVEIQFRVLSKQLAHLVKMVTP
jgi:hypothetical protein